MKMNLALYARVSTFDADDEESQDPEVQLVDLRRYAALHGYAIVREYVDRGISGTIKERPQLDRMMNDSLLGEFQGVLVWKFDRFARSVRHLLDALDVFRREDIAFISMTEGIDTSTSVGKLVLSILGAVAEFERDILIERTRAGMRQAAAQGIHCGRPRKLLN